MAKIFGNYSLEGLHMERASGVLLAISSLPGNQGIGDFGKPAYTFIDLLHEHGFKIWQILPLHPLGYGNSPYQPFSTYAGDPLYINIDHLSELGLLKMSSIRNYRKFHDSVDYEGVREFKEPYYRKAYRSFKKQFNEFKDSYEAFCETSPWLDTYAMFAALKKKNDGHCWLEWPQEDKDWIKTKEARKDVAEEVAYEKFLQFMFYVQWDDIKVYANANGIKIMGDMPIYVGIDSADVWENQQDFILDKEGNPTCVAGVPPDYFSEDGQRWGNPLYNWKRLKKERYAFWIDRLSWAKDHFDITRIDHFRGFDTYWKIPADCETAIEGEWEEGPAYDLFDRIYRVLPDIEIVAEDLGDLRDEVHELRDAYELYGMRVLQFEMEPKKLKKGLPERVIVYTGTHDNMTLEEWYEIQHQNLKIALRRFFHNRDYNERNFHDLVIHFALDSNADICMLPMQDILGLRSSGRMNTPATIGSPNWEWKLKNFKDVLPELPKISEWIKSSKR